PVRRSAWPRCRGRCFELKSTIITSLSDRLALALPWGTGASGLRLRDVSSTTQLRDRAEEQRLPWVPIQHAINQSPARAHDLARHLQKRVQERLEFHAQHRGLVAAMTLLPASGRLDGPQRPPGFQVPGQ